MSYKFILPYVISTAALMLSPASTNASHTRTSDNDNNKDKVVKIPDSANFAVRDTTSTIGLNPEIERQIYQQIDSILNIYMMPFQVEQMGRNVVYVYRDGHRVVRHGGTRAWRNNNPGNLRYYDFAKRNGAIGVAGNFAVFPDEETGMQALYNLLQTDSYKNLTITNALKRYAPSTWHAYTRKLTRLTGLSADTKLRSLNQTQLNTVAQTIRQIEGWVAGHENQYSAQQYAMVHATQQKAR